MNKRLFFIQLVLAFFVLMTEAKKFRLSHELTVDPTHQVNYGNANSLHSADEQKYIDAGCKPVLECEGGDLPDVGKEKTCKTVYKC